MTFIELLQKLEAQLGYHQIPLNPGATSLKNLFDNSPLHHELVKELVQSIYAGNRCRRLIDPIERTATFDALAPIRLKVLKSERTDVDLFQLIEEFGVVLDRIFGPLPRVVTPNPRQTAEIIQLAPFRRHTRLKTWA